MATADCCVGLRAIKHLKVLILSAANRIVGRFALGVFLVAMAWSPAKSGPIDVSELRGGVYFYTVYRGFVPYQLDNWSFDRLEAVKGSVIFESPDHDLFEWIGSPRPEIGATVNLHGDPGFVHANLVWTVPVFDTPLFLDLGFGAAINNAPAEWTGCPLGFYERAGVGLEVTDNVSLIAAYEHTSNLDLCDANSGISNFGLSLAVKLP